MEAEVRAAEDQTSHFFIRHRFRSSSFVPAREEIRAMVSPHSGAVKWGNERIAQTAI
jgi:hypothetical protein